MAKDKKLVTEITSMDEDFAQWYTDICKKAELIEYTSVKGCMVIRPYGYAIWENIQRILDTTMPLQLLATYLASSSSCVPPLSPSNLSTGTTFCFFSSSISGKAVSFVG